MSKPLVIIPCCAKKAPGKKKAYDLYQGTGYLGVVRTHSARVGEDYDLAFLSAEYGLVMADTVIANYDRKMDKSRAAELIAEPADAVAIIQQCNPSEIIACMPKLYMSVLTAWLESASLSCSMPEAGSGIGSQRSFLKAALDRIVTGNPLSLKIFVSVSPAKDPSLPRQVRLQLKQGDSCRFWTGGTGDEATYTEYRKIALIKEVSRGVYRIWDQHGMKWGTGAIILGLGEVERRLIDEVAEKLNGTQDDTYLTINYAEIMNMIGNDKLVA